MGRIVVVFLMASVALAGCTTKPPVDGPDVPGPVSNLLCDFPCDISVASKPWIEYEPSVAVNPTNPLNIIVGVHDDPIGNAEYAEVNNATPAPGYIRLSAQVTMDGGRSWTHQFLPITTDAEPGSKWAAICNMGDPVVLFAPNGTAYYFGLGIGCGDPQWWGAMSYLFVTMSTDGGVTWGEPVFVWQAPGLAQFQDKQWAAVDPRTGHIAVSWSAFEGGLYPPPPVDTRPVLGETEPVASVDLLVSVSRDGGSTWSATPTTIVRSGPVPDSPVWEESSENVNYFSVPAWGPDGELYVVYRTCADTCVKMAVSEDGGATWMMSKVADVVTDDRRTDKVEQFTFHNFGVVDVDRSGGDHDGRVYVSFKGRLGADFDILLVWSDDAGKSWSAPLALNDNAGTDAEDQFMHWIDVDEEGVVHGVFFDRRNSENNTWIQAAYASYDPWTGQVVNAVLEEAWDPVPGKRRTPAYGHYNTISVVNGTVGIAWTRATEAKPDQEPATKADNWDMDAMGAVLRIVAAAP